MATHPLLAHLNPEQLDGAQSINGIILLEAGPGTGKTATTTSRAAYMVDQGVDPRAILMLTFTNKAANEMKERVVDKIGVEGYRVCATTFHKFVARYALSPNQQHDYFKSIGFDKGFICLDQEDALKLIKEAMSAVHPDIQKFLDNAKKTPKQIMSWLSVVRAKGYTPQEYHHSLLIDDPSLKEVWSKMARKVSINIKGDTSNNDTMANELKSMLNKHPKVMDIALCHVWELYKKQCLSVSGIDYDDMLVLTDKLLKHDPVVAKRLASQFQYISVDEMQDTNPVQMSIISQIVAQHVQEPNLFMVGDPRQSIYGFRAADITIMTTMNQRYADTKLISLIRNYRSTTQQIKTNNAHAITMNGQLSDGQLIPHNAGNKKAQLDVFDNDYQEAASISAKIQHLISEGVSPSQIAVLYRSRPVRKEVEEMLANDSVKYTIIGDTAFWEKKEVKDAVAFIRFCSRPNDVMAASRVLDAVVLGATGQHLRKNVHHYGNGAKSYIQFVGDKKQRTKPDLKRFADRVCAMQPSYFHPIDEATFLQSMMIDRDEWDQIKTTLSDEERRSLESTREKMNKDNLRDCAAVIHGLWEDFGLPRIKAECLKKVDKNQKTMDEALEEFRAKNERCVSVFNHLTELLTSDVTFAEAVDELSLRVENANVYDENNVQMMTMHAAKGLEFEHVFLPGLEHENFFRGDDETITDNIDEEGRVFFVAISRDKECKYLSYSHTRFVNGQSRENTPLSFIDNVIEHCEVTNHSKFVALDCEQDSVDEHSIAGEQLNKHNAFLAKVKQSEKPVNTGSTVDQNQDEQLTDVVANNTALENHEASKQVIPKAYNFTF